MKKASISAIFLFCSLCFSLLSFRSIAISVNVERITLKPEFHAGRVNNLVYRIHNNSDSVITVAGNIKHPDGWRLAIPMMPLKINAGAVVVQIFSLSIPPQFKAGVVDIEVNFNHSGSYQSNIFAEKLHVTVTERESLSLELIEAPGFLRAGDHVKSLFVLKNTGNSERRIFLEPSGGEILNQQFLTLKPGESVIVDMVIRAPVNIPLATSYSFGLTASVSENTRERVFRNIQVFPVAEKQEDLWFRYPVSFSSKYLARGRNGQYFQGYQFEAFGEGYLDEKQKHHFEFMARGPNNFDLSFLGLYDQYYAWYRNNTIDIFGGHKSFSTTPLMEAARFGTGFETNIRLGDKFKAGVYYMEPRFYRNIKYAMAAYARINFYNKNELAIYAMKKSNLPGEVKSDLLSITSELQPLKNSRLELEYSLGTRGTETDDAWRINLNSQIWKLFISGNYHHTGKNYPGYYSNSTFYSGNISMNLTRKLNFGFSSRQDFMNAELDTLWSHAPFSKNYQIAANYRISQNMNLRSYFMKYEREDRMPVRQFHYSAESFNAYLSHFINRLGYEIGGEFGKTENLLIMDQERFKDTYRLLGNLSYRPSGNFYIQAFANLTNQNSFISASQKDLLWGLSASGTLTKNLRTSLYVQNSYSIEEYYRNRNLFQFNVDYTFLRRHKISLNSFYTIFQNEIEKPDYSFALSYSVNIGIPVKKTGSSGTVVCLVTGPDGSPVNNMVVFLEGRSGITDPSGMVTFRNVKPGLTQMLIDRSALGPSLIPDVEMPLNLDVMPDSENKVKIKLVNGARISGTVTFAPVEKIAGSTELTPPSLENIILELQGHNQSVRIATGSRGKFSFPLLRQGIWKLVVFRSTIDERYSLEKEIYEFEIEPGKEEEVEIRLIPRQRRIIFSPSTVTLSNANTSLPLKQMQVADKASVSLEEKGLKKISFGVQVMASVTEVSSEELILNDSEKLNMFRQGNWYKYYFGKFNTIVEARKARLNILNKFPDAFIIAFDGDNPIDLDEALKWIRK